MKVKILSSNGYRIVELNRRKAIRERCIHCSGWSYNEVTNCIFHACPLFEYRSGKGHQDPIQRKQSIREYCEWCMQDNIYEVSKCCAVTCPLFAFRLGDRIDHSVEVY